MMINKENLTEIKSLATLRKARTGNCEELNKLRVGIKSRLLAVTKNSVLGLLGEMLGKLWNVYR